MIDNGDPPPMALNMSLTFMSKMLMVTANKKPRISEVWLISRNIGRLANRHLNSVNLLSQCFKVMLKG